ncbi:MAG: ATP-dependent zinc metalloprotease FtsH [Oscillospiraceae bacterium]|nr:ATP-dependent zinc metalloprotease FtsH [Oscillospiraceae bacterium]
MKPRKVSPRDLGFYILILVILISVVYLLATSGDIPSTEIENYSEVRRLFENGDVEYFSIEDGVLTMRLTEVYGDTGTDTVYHELMDLSIFYADMSETIDELMVTQEEFEYNYKVGMQIPWWVSMIPYILIFVIIFVLWGVMASKAGVGGDRGAAKFSKARTRLGSEEKKKVTFADVAGADEEKEELQEIVDFLKNPQKYTALGARIPKGVLLVGPPGTGKTLIAKAVAGEANTQFLSISGSDFVELYVGVGASRVRDLFDQAKKLAPSIIFIDEIDAVGRQRGAGLGGGHDEREQTLNQLLVEMDGFGSNEGVIVMAATNRADILDNALLRPGRFDRQIYVGVPDIKGREEILKVHAKGKMLGEDVDLRSIARGTPGFTGADLENLLNEGALLAARRNKRFITMEELDEASLKVIAGPAKKSRLVTEKERKLTAYHEAGHAVSAFYLENADPVHHITIIPRGQAGGMTVYRPTEDQTFSSKGEMFDRIVMSLGGRVAEQLMLDDISTGASGDIQQASSIARAMVTKYGMSDRLGPISFDDSSHSIFIGRDFSQTKTYSEQTAAIIDEEVRDIFERAQAKCTEILNEHRDLLIAVAEYLLENESMEGADFIYMCEHNGEVPPKKDKAADVNETPEDDVIIPEEIVTELPTDEAPENKNQQ